jgi:disulfide bond formation protein DsbB
MLYSETSLRSRWLDLTVRDAAIFIAAVSAATLASVWIIQFIGYKPCPLCLQERMPYYAAVPAGIIAAYIARESPRLAAIILTAVCLGLLYGAGIGVYHAGAEWQLWKGPDTCSGDGIQVAGSLAKRLQNNLAVRCDQAPFRIIGLSLAGYNVLLSSGLAAVGAAALGPLLNPKRSPKRQTETV